MGKRKKRKRKNNNKMQLRKRLKANPVLKDIEIVEASNQEKMSAVILRFVEPYKATATSKEAYEKLIVFAMVAWNASILEGVARQQIIDTIRKEILSSSGEKGSQDLDEMLTMLMQRKERYFADNKRLILDYSVSESKHEFHLAIISTP